MERKRLADGENQGNVERLELDKDKYCGRWREELLGIQKVYFLNLMLALVGSYSITMITESAFIQSLFIS